MICMEDRYRVVGCPVLEHYYKSTVAKSFWALPIRDQTVAKQLVPISLCEMGAMFRENVVALTQFMRGH